MKLDLALFLSEDMLWQALIIAAPLLGISMLVGLLVSLFQVVTQIQEMTLTFIPKMIAMVVVIFLLGPWMLGHITEYTTTLYQSIPDLIQK